jgi:DNA-directed RNA polymerase specialized sigma24 family protein
MTPAEAFEAHHSTMLRLARRWFGRDDAEDAVAVMWVHAIQGWGQYRGDALMTTWLSRILRNAWIMEIRKRQTREALSLPLIDGYDIPVPAGFDVGGGSDLQRVLRRMRPKYRGHLMEWANRDRHDGRATIADRVRWFRAIQVARRAAE